MKSFQNEFGEFLKSIIKSANISQFEFYTQLGITKSYFYDILSGKANPPPAPLQKRTVEILKINSEMSISFYDLAAKSRREIPADIVLMLRDNPKLIYILRNNLKELKEMKRGNDYE